MNKLKRELDTLLVEWKPQNLSAVGVGVEPAKVGYLARRSGLVLLSNVTSTQCLILHYKRYFFWPSSPVFGDHFIHSYEVGHKLCLDLRLMVELHEYWHVNIIQEILTDLGVG